MSIPEHDNAIERFPNDYQISNQLLKRSQETLKTHGSTTPEPTEIYPITEQTSPILQKIPSQTQLLANHEIKTSGYFTPRGQIKYSDRASKNVISFKPVESRLFALIIGINDYTKSTKLRGARADALAVDEYLRTALSVPSNRITVLLDQGASRDAIINGFMGLRDNKEIQPGDPILIFYAGHGAEISEGTGKIQSIIPQNHDGIDVHPIPDWTIGSLLAQIHAAKGDNITVILDCCHSGGGCRADAQFLVRAVEVDTSYKLPEGLDSGITKLARSSQPAKNFAPGALKTHVLLAACSDKELALESGGRGQFTTALLKLLKVTPPQRLTYDETPTLMDKIVGQNPQCEGINRKRRFFDGKAPSRVPRLYRVYKDAQRYTLHAGLIHGLSVGAKFNIYSGSDLASVLRAIPICKMVVESVVDFEATLGPVTQGTIIAEDLKDIWAFQTETGDMVGPKLFMAPNDHPPLISNALVHLRTTQSPYQVNFTLAEDRTGADLEVKFENNGQFGFTILDEQITRHGLHHLTSKVEANFDNVVQVLSTGAHFFHQLHSSKSNPFIDEGVEIQFLRVEESTMYSDRIATGPNLITGGMVSLEIVDGQEIYYGAEIVNKTDRDLYPHLFSLDSSDLAIKSYYGRGTQASGGYKVDAPLRSDESLKIGYGNGGADAFDFYLPDNQNIDVSFLKFVFSTKPVDLEDVECDSPFVSKRGSRPAPRPPKILNNDEWGSIMIPIVLKRKLV